MADSRPFGEQGIANHGALRLKLQGARGALACPTRAILGRMWLNFLSVYHRALGGSRTPGALIDRFTFTL